MSYYMFIPLVIIMLTCIRKNSKKLGFVGTYAGISTGMLVYYAVIPFVVFLFQEGYNDNIRYYGFDNVIKQIINSDSISIYRVVGYIVIGFFAFHFSYNVRTSIRPKNNSKVRYNPVREETFEHYLVTAKILFILSLPSLIIYVLGLGGIIQALALAERMRSFSVSVSTYVNPVIGLFKVPASFISVDSFFWLYVTKKRPTSLNRLIFFVSFLASIVYFFIDAGRMRLILYIFIIFYVAFRKRIKHFWIWILFFGVLNLGLIDSLSELFLFTEIRNFKLFKYDSVVYLNVIREFSYPIRSLLHLPEIVDEYGLLYFKNLVLDTVSFLPGIDSDKSYFLVSEFFGGYNWRSKGGVPDDILTYGYINLGVPGIIILMWIIGKICNYCDQYLMTLSSSDTKMFWGIVLAGSMFNLVASADWSAVLFNNVSLTVPIVIMLIDHKRRVVQMK